MRPATIGKVPPACAKTNWILGLRYNVPVTKRLMIARAVSCGTSATCALRVAEPDSRRGKRDDGKLYAVPVHLLKRFLGRPFEPSGADKSATRRRNLVGVFGQIEWRHNVMMKVDQAAVGALCRVFRR